MEKQSREEHGDPARSSSACTVRSSWTDLRNLRPDASATAPESPDVNVVQNADATIVNGFGDQDKLSSFFSRNRDIDESHVAFAGVAFHLGKVITSSTQDPD